MPSGHRRRGWRTVVGRCRPIIRPGSAERVGLLDASIRPATARDRRRSSEDERDRVGLLAIPARRDGACPARADLLVTPTGRKQPAATLPLTLDEDGRACRARRQEEAHERSRHQALRRPQLAYWRRRLPLEHDHARCCARPATRRPHDLVAHARTGRIADQALHHPPLPDPASRFAAPLKHHMSRTTQTTKVVETPGVTPGPTPIARRRTPLRW